MKKKSLPYTHDEIALAQRLFAENTTEGTLKPPRGLCAIGLSNGVRRSVSSPVTWRDYRRDARKLLSQQR